MGNSDKSKVQGEGDYEAARRHRQGAENYVEHADVDKAAHEAAPKSPEEQKQMDEAEQKGRERAKGQGRQPH